MIHDTLKRHVWPSFMTDRALYTRLRAGLRDKQLEEKQLQLLLSGWKALKSGGYLVYHAWVQRQTNVGQMTDFKMIGIEMIWTRMLVIVWLHPILCGCLESRFLQILHVTGDVFFTMLLVVYRVYRHQTALTAGPYRSCTCINSNRL